MNLQKQRRHIVDHFHKFYTDESAQTKKFISLSRFMITISMLALVIMFYEAFNEFQHIPLWAIVIISFFSGFAFAFRIWFKENADQWAFFQEFLNQEKIEKAAKEYEKSSDT